MRSRKANNSLSDEEEDAMILAKRRIKDGSTPETIEKEIMELGLDQAEAVSIVNKALMAQHKIGQRTLLFGIVLLLLGIAGFVFPRTPNDRGVVGMWGPVVGGIGLLVRGYSLYNEVRSLMSERNLL